MSLFTKKEKMDMKTKKFITTKKGIIDHLPKIHRYRSPVYKKLEPQIKKYEAEQRRLRKIQKRKQRTKWQRKRDDVVRRLEKISEGFE